jgi:1,4-alpha-glucan branching enzyme
MKDFRLEAGLGIFFDMFHVDGLRWDDLKKITYPTFALGLRF